MYQDESITIGRRYVSLFGGKCGSLSQSGGEKYKTYTGDARPENYGDGSSIQIGEGGREELEWNHRINIKKIRGRKVSGRPLRRKSD